MKNATHILASLQQQPQFSKLAQFECIRRIRELFPPRLQALIRYGYIHNGILYFVLAHPGARQEFDLIIASIKVPLKQYSPPECKETPITDIRAYVKHLPPEPSETMKKHPTDLTYAERAHGHFLNPIDNDDLHQTVERIRKLIHARTDSPAS